MFGKSIIVLAESLSEGDQQYRKPLKNVIPHYNALIDDPRSYLDAQEVRIKPGNRVGIALALGGMLGFIFSCGTLAGVFADFPRIGKRPWPEQLGIWLLMLSGPVLTIGVFLYWLRGGEITLYTDRIEFRFRHRVVTCPWRLFNVRGDPAWLDSWTLAMPVNRQAIREVNLLSHGDVVETGRDIDSKQFRFRADSRERITNKLDIPEIALRDLYQAKLMEIGGLLLILGSKLGEQEDSHQPAENDEPDSGA
jgi:hypothetical protein